MSRATNLFAWFKDETDWVDSVLLELHPTRTDLGWVGGDMKLNQTRREADGLGVDRGGTHSFAV